MLLNFPPPANWQDFQLLTARLVELKCIEGTVREYGRQGQRQDGVDVYGEMHNGEHLGVQCKEMQPGRKLTQRLIQTEADKARDFKPGLNTFVLATTLPEDTAMHQAVTTLNQSGAYPFRITYWSWKHFNDVLNRSNQVVQDSYKIYAQSFGFDQELADLQAIRTGFDRPAFIDDFSYEMRYVDFVHALSDTVLFLETGLLRDRQTNSLVSATYARGMLPAGPSKTLRTELKREVTALRIHATQDLKDGRLDASAATVYNARRRAVLETLNRGLQRHNMPPIAASY